MRRSNISYLFILGAEDLSSLLNHAEEVGEMKGVAISRRRLKINYILFVDDSVLFCREKIEEWN